MKKLAILLALVLLFTFKSKAQVTKSVVTDTATTDFITQADISGMKEARSSNVAERHAMSKDLKILGAQLANDNIEAHKQLMKLARHQGYKFTRPTLINTEPDAELAHNLGEDFDRLYINDIIRQHQQEVMLYENAAQCGANADIKAFAAQYLPKLKHDLADIQKMASEMNVNSGELMAVNKSN